jgi:hypothetical protein
LAILADEGVTAIETTSAAVTVRVVLPVTPERVAEMLDEPTPPPLARPELLIVAADVVALDQLTELVMSAVPLSV